MDRRAGRVPRRDRALALARGPDRGGQRDPRGARALRGRGGDHALELPLRDAARALPAGARDGQRVRAQAQRARAPGGGALARGVLRGAARGGLRPPAGARRGRRGPGRGRRRHDRLRREPRDRQAHHVQRQRGPEAAGARARWQGPPGRVRGRRPRRRGGVRGAPLPAQHGPGLLQRRARLRRRPGGRGVRAPGRREGSGVDPRERARRGLAHGTDGQRRAAAEGRRAGQGRRRRRGAPAPRRVRRRASRLLLPGHGPGRRRRGARDLPPRDLRAGGLARALLRRRGRGRAPRQRHALRARGQRLHRRPSSAGSASRGASAPDRSG